MIFIDRGNNTDSILVLGEYHPYRLPNGEMNPNFDRNWSGRILDIKENKSSAVEFFYQRIPAMSTKEFAVAVVPSHDPEKLDSGIRSLAQRIASVQGRIDATSCLVRNRKIDKLSRGGQRNISVHLTSIQVKNSQLIEGKEVLLLDDVCTSGNSLVACKKLLLSAGAEFVQCVALGQTVRDLADEEI